MKTCRPCHISWYLGHITLFSMPPSGVATAAESYTELTVILAQAAMSIKLDVNISASSECSWLDDWFLGMELAALPPPSLGDVITFLPPLEFPRRRTLFEHPPALPAVRLSGGV